MPRTVLKSVFKTLLQSLQGSRLYPHLLLLLASTLVAGSFIASDHLAGQINPVSLTLMRFFIATLCLAPFVLSTRDASRKAVSILPRAFLLSFFYAAFFVGMFESLTLTTTLNTATIYTLVPLITALIAAVFLREKVGLVRVAIYFLGALGTLWVIFEGQMTQLLALDMNTGDWIFFLASLSMCCYSVAMKLFYKQDSIWLFVWCTLLGAMIWLFFVMLVFDIPLEWEKLPFGAWRDILYLALATTLLTAYLYQKSTVLLGPSEVTSYIYLNPALVAMLAFFVEGTLMSSVVIPGILLSVFSTVLLLRCSK